MSTTPDPGPSPLIGENTIYADQVGLGGPIDHTPVDHNAGDGVGAGLTPAESQAENAAARSVDYNATAARRWNAPMDVDGQNVAERLQEQAPIGQLGSMETVALHVGTNRQAYPNQVVGHRIHRWRDRVFARQVYQTDHRPLYTPNAYTPPNRAGGNDYLVSPYPQLGQVNTVMEKAPQLRRVPEPWGNAVIVDAVSSEPPLDVWGL